MASALVTCAKLGLRVKYIGTVGDDERGRIQLASLRETGINLDDVEVREDCPNQTAKRCGSRSSLLMEQATSLLSRLDSPERKHRNPSKR